MIPTTVLPARRWSRPLLLAALAGVCAVSCGCISRKMVIVTDPPGVQVFLNGEERGRSQEAALNDEALGVVEIPFQHYGRSEVILKLPGHETQTHYLDPPIPTDEYFPVDFFVDVLWPFQVEHVFTYRFSMERTEFPSPDATHAEAQSFREESGMRLAQEALRGSP